MNENSDEINGMSLSKTGIVGYNRIREDDWNMRNLRISKQKTYMKAIMEAASGRCGHPWPERPSGGDSTESGHEEIKRKNKPREGDRFESI